MVLQQKGKNKGSEQGKKEEAGDVLTVQESDQALYTIDLIIIPVAVIKKDTDTVDKKISTGCINGKTGTPCCFSHNEGQHNGHIHPDKSQEDGLADSDLFQPRKQWVRDLRG